MRSKSSWLFLTVSFLCGLISAFVVAYYTFDAKPVEVHDPGPMVKILITKREIPRGAELTAEAVKFEDAPVSELPEEVLTNFSQIYRRRAAYSIPAGYPVCEDFLLSREDSELTENKYLPAGSQIVSLEVEQLRQGGAVSELEVPISQYLSAEQRISIRAVPREASNGVYVQRRNELLKKYTSKGESPEDGELVLEDIVIHRVEGKSSGDENDNRQVQTLSLILDDVDAEKLMTAARNGRLRVIPHRSASESVDSDVLASSTLEEDASKTAVSVKEATDAPKNKSDEVVALRSPTPKHASPASGSSDDQAVPKNKEAVISFVSPKIIYSERNETRRVGESSHFPNAMTEEPEARQAVEEEKSEVKRELFTAPSPSRFVGGALITEEEDKTAPTNYSPFNTRTRLSNLLITEPEENGEGKNTTEQARPLPLRSRATSQILR